MGSPIVFVLKKIFHLSISYLLQGDHRAEALTNCSPICQNRGEMSILTCYPLVNIQKAIEHGTVEIVDLPHLKWCFSIANKTLSLPEGTSTNLGLHHLGPPSEDDELIPPPFFFVLRIPGC